MHVKEPELDQYVPTGHAVYESSVHFLQIFWEFVDAELDRIEAEACEDLSSILASLAECYRAMAAVVLVGNKDRSSSCIASYHCEPLKISNNHDVQRVSDKVFETQNCCRIEDQSGSSLLGFPCHDVNGSLTGVVVLMCCNDVLGINDLLLSKECGKSLLSQISYSIARVEQSRRIPFDIRYSASWLGFLRKLAKRIAMAFDPNSTDCILWEIDRDENTAQVLATSGIDTEYIIAESLPLSDSFVGAVSRKKPGVMYTIDNFDSTQTFVRKDKVVPMQLRKAIGTLVDCEQGTHLVLVIYLFDGYLNSSTCQKPCPSPVALLQAAEYLRCVSDRQIQERSRFLDWKLRTLIDSPDVNCLQAAANALRECLSSYAVEITLHKSGESRSLCRFVSGLDSLGSCPSIQGSYGIDFGSEHSSVSEAYVLDQPESRHPPYSVFECSSDEYLEYFLMVKLYSLVGRRLVSHDDATLVSRFSRSIMVFLFRTLRRMQVMSSQDTCLNLKSLRETI